MRQTVTSIQTALVTIGDDLIRRIGTLAVTSELNAWPSPEILRMALVRAKFCEITSPLCSFDSTDQYLLGLFSLLPAMLQTPMEEAITGLPLSVAIREALLGTANPFRCPLEWIEMQERGEFEKADALAGTQGFMPGLLCDRFTEATLWADQLLCE
jgi:EAL and modified HD-GYP domain-containing signal transduction protein